MTFGNLNNLYFAFDFCCHTLGRAPMLHMFRDGPFNMTKDKVKSL